MTAIAIVTGAALGGIGYACATLFAERGLTVVLNDINEGRLAEAVDRLKTSGHAASAHVSDLTTRTGCEGLVAAAARLGKVEVLAHAAGDYTAAPIADLDDGAWERMFDVNLRSTLHVNRAAADQMSESGGGRIVNFASIDAYRAMPHLSHYAAAKAGVVSLTRSFAEHYGPSGVLINAIAPGAVVSARAKSEVWLEKYKTLAPLRRYAEPDDIAEVAWFLVSPANRCITGETVIASCGSFMG
jgi:NAD(P)-dependent dehydrogenase (short-subunit alcohol dehydrogenase family)